MKDYILHHEWKIIEEGFNPDLNRISESIFSIGNGRMGQRANFEEKYTGDTLRGAYIAGIYYPDKTRVGWWKNGYPEYFAKIINSANWIGISVFVNKQELDLAKVKKRSFRRELDMKKGVLNRRFIAEMPDGSQVEVVSLRFLSLDNPQLGAISYSVKAINFSGEITLVPYIDGDVVNEDSNYDEKFWTAIAGEANGNCGYVVTETLKTGFRVFTGQTVRFLKNGRQIFPETGNSVREKYVESSAGIFVGKGEKVTVEKINVTLTTLDFSPEELISAGVKTVRLVAKRSFRALLKKQAVCWAEKWETSDIKIEGDIAAQQGIRYNIFQLNQSYAGNDERFNIGPKGFTGEKYGGVTYWDTEAYCLPFYLSTASPEIARNLLLYRYRHLENAIRNAGKLGFNNFAALYPMVTINGEECHNEWEITFEEIHRNGAIAYAIWNYINYTGDREYLAPYGFEVLLAISRFWSQRISWSVPKQKYVLLGVTGPNEYENNVNNNFYTNYLAVWTLKFTLSTIAYLRQEFPGIYYESVKKLKFNDIKEPERWNDIIEKMHFPFDEALNLYLQQDGFLDKEIAPASEIKKTERPINQNWSWDRILRSCYIKQADTLQALFWFEDEFSPETVKAHFDFYEPLTVHESSLSPCVHSILAAKIGYYEKAYELYLRTARLDLDDYNNDTVDGLHITSMAGTWMSFVYGFGGMRVNHGRISLNPFLPANWKSYSFKINFRGAHLELVKQKNSLTIKNHSESPVPVTVWGKEYNLAGYEQIKIEKRP
jgi:maltose phosphorylase